jgi:hypothetical protein
MKKDILAKAIRLADKSKARPDKVVIGKPTFPFRKPAAQVLSERLYTRLTPGEMKRLKAHVGTTDPISTLLRTLVLDYLDKNDHDQPRRKK